MPHFLLCLFGTKVKTNLRTQKNDSASDELSNYDWTDGSNWDHYWNFFIETGIVTFGKKSYMNTHITGQSFPGGPDSEKGLWKCVHANDHTWLSKDCSVVFNFICKVVHYIVD